MKKPTTLLPVKRGVFARIESVMNTKKTFRVSAVCWLTLIASIALAQDNLNSASTSRDATVEDLRRTRDHHDKTTWANEVTAQKYEKIFVALWDNLLRAQNKAAVFEQLPFQTIKIGSEEQDKLLEWSIVQRKFSSDRKLNRNDALILLRDLVEQGYELVESEWHHSDFTPQSKVAPAKSTVSILLHIAKSNEQRRIIVRGDLKIDWQNTETPTLGDIDASQLTMWLRDGDPGFDVERVLSYDVGSKDTASGSVHPVIVHDLNQDGLPEIVVSGFNEVQWNRGNWKLEKQQLCKYPVNNIRSAVFADFTGDGIDDYLCFAINQPPFLYRGEKGGVFSTPPRKVGIAMKLEKPSTVTVGDVDGDGDLDAFIGQQKPSYTSGFIPTPYFDANYGYPFILMLNDGNGNFKDGTLLAGLGVKRLRHVFSSTLVDLDDDADLDLLLTNDFCGCDYFLNDGSGVFIDARDTLKPTPRAFGMSHSFGDYNRDGKLDMIAIGMSSTTARRLEKMKLYRDGFDEYDAKRPEMGYGNRLFLNTGDGFEQASFNSTVARTGWSWGSTTFDFDRDGDQDLYIVNGQTSGKTTKDYCTRFWCHDLYYKPGERPDNAVGQLFKQLGPLFSGEMVSWNGYEHNALLMNQDGKGFVNVGYLMNVAFEFDARLAVSGDLDQDGRVDVIVEHKDIRNKKRHLYVIRNRWQDKHHWLGVHLRGNELDTPYGAKVELELSDGTKLLQHCLAGHSVWAQHPTTVHFGMGARTAKSLSVTWPNGKVSTVNLPKNDNYIALSPKHD